MKEDRIFFGNINQCTCYTRIKKQVNPKVEIDYILKKSELYKEKVLLMKAKNGLFVEIEGLNICELALVYNASIGKKLMKTDPNHENDLYIDEKSLQPYNQKFSFNKKILRK